MRTVVLTPNAPTVEVARLPKRLCRQDRRKNLTEACKPADVYVGLCNMVFGIKAADKSQ